MSSRNPSRTKRAQKAAQGKIAELSNFTPTSSATTSLPPPPFSPQALYRQNPLLPSPTAKADTPRPRPRPQPNILSKIRELWGVEFEASLPSWPSHVSEKVAMRVLRISKSTTLQDFAEDIKSIIQHRLDLPPGTGKRSTPQMTIQDLEIYEKGHMPEKSERRRTRSLSSSSQSSPRKDPTANTGSKRRKVESATLNTSLGLGIVSDNGRPEQRKKAKGVDIHQEIHPIHISPSRKKPSVPQDDETEAFDGDTLLGEEESNEEPFHLRDEGQDNEGDCGTPATWQSVQDAGSTSRGRFGSIPHSQSFVRPDGFSPSSPLSDISGLVAGVLVPDQRVSDQPTEHNIEDRNWPSSSVAVSLPSVPPELLETRPSIAYSKVDHVDLTANAETGISPDSETWSPPEELIYRSQLLNQSSALRLADREWYNDEVMNTYSAILQANKPALDTYVCTTLFNGQRNGWIYEPGINFSQPKNLDFHTVKSIIIPCHASPTHWILVIISGIGKNPGPAKAVVHILDSMSATIHTPGKIGQFYRDWYSKSTSTPSECIEVRHHTSVPQQSNGFDCGPFVLHHIEKLITDPSKFWENLYSGTLEGVGAKGVYRKHIREKIMALRYQQTIDWAEKRGTGLSPTETCRHCVADILLSLTPRADTSSSKSHSHLTNPSTSKLNVAPPTNFVPHTPSLTQVTKSFPSNVSISARQAHSTDSENAVMASETRPDLRRGEESLLAAIQVHIDNAKERRIALTSSQKEARERYDAVCAELEGLGIENDALENISLRMQKLREMDQAGETLKAAIDAEMSVKKELGTLLTKAQTIKFASSLSL
ncbi:hypothetical protein VTL71DRAFT_9449 [Oculimacula yallundae]|uniref:Ubiquitin-like protease family profile domain-containing protein n=1 Tax=Oculimacula yallundae TaxID=86028 RepID=A0ABR4BRY2_9HELO